MAAAHVPSRRLRRFAGRAAIGSGAAAVICAVAAVVAGSSASVTGPEQVVPPASLAVAPSTIPPRTGPASSSAPARAAEPVGPEAAAHRPARTNPPSPTTTRAPSTTTTTTAALSPLNSLVGEAVSAQPAPPLVDVAPAAITIGAIGATAPVRSVGTAPDGQLEVPDETQVGWYRHGAAPGQPGATVLAAHVSWRGRAGPFLRLGELEPGAFVDVALSDGSSRRYQVVTRAQYGKLMLPREEIWRTTGPETLVLITCGGAFNPDIRRYADNIVVTAVPVA